MGKLKFALLSKNILSRMCNPAGRKEPAGFFEITEDFMS
jgi:hypothetical protein